MAITREDKEYWTLCAIYRMRRKCLIGWPDVIKLLQTRGGIRGHNSQRRAENLARIWKSSIPMRSAP